MLSARAKHWYIRTPLIQRQKTDELILSRDTLATKKSHPRGGRYLRDRHEGRALNTMDGADRVAVEGGDACLSFCSVFM